MGLLHLSPSELVEFLFKEMHQDFSDLGIEIEDFLSDLIKTRHEEEISFAIYNNYINKTQTNTLDAKADSSQLSQNIKVNASSSPNESTDKNTPPLSPKANLPKKNVQVSDPPSNSPPQTIDKPIILKDHEMRKHQHRYDLRIGI
jgi:hypothetical protein